jgi:hypothetical protein
VLRHKISAQNLALTAGFLLFPALFLTRSVLRKKTRRLLRIVPPPIIQRRRRRICMTYCALHILQAHPVSSAVVIHVTRCAVVSRAHEPAHLSAIRCDHSIIHAASGGITDAPRLWVRRPAHAWHGECSGSTVALPSAFRSGSGARKTAASEKTSPATCAATALFFTVVMPPVVVSVVVIVVAPPAGANACTLLSKNTKNRSLP